MNPIRTFITRRPSQSEIVSTRAGTLIRHSGVMGLICAALVDARPAGAELITFSFEGQITEVQDSQGVLGGSIPVGTPFAGTYTFETTTPDSLPELPQEGAYLGALVDFVLLIGDQPLFRDGADNDILVGDRLDGDQYQVQDRSVTLLSSVVHATILLEDFDGAALADDALPQLPPVLALFDVHDFIVGWQHPPSLGG